VAPMKPLPQINNESMRSVVPIHGTHATMRRVAPMGTHASSDSVVAIINKNLECSPVGIDRSRCRLSRLGAYGMLSRKAGLTSDSGFHCSP
jgi:hypothetical protein